MLDFIFPSKCFFLSLLYLVVTARSSSKLVVIPLSKRGHVNRVRLEDPDDTKFLSVDSDLHSLEFSVSVWTKKKGMKPALVLFLR